MGADRRRRPMDAGLLTRNTEPAHRQTTVFVPSSGDAPVRYSAVNKTRIHGILRRFPPPSTREGTSEWCPRDVAAFLAKRMLQPPSKRQTVSHFHNERRLPVLLDGTRKARPRATANGSVCSILRWPLPKGIKISPSFWIPPGITYCTNG